MMAGIGSRFKNEIPKQFTLIEGKPLFTYLVVKLSRLKCITGIVVVTNPLWLDYTKEWINRVGVQKIVSIVPGGETRSNSVFNGLKALKGVAGDTDPVLMHDATHPFVDEEGTKRVAELVSEYGSATLASLNYDTTYLMDDDNNVVKVIPRKNVIAGASPEGFRYKQIFDIYSQTPEEEMEEMTSVGAIALAHSIPMKVVPTSVLNLKITYPEDFQLFKELFNKYYLYNEE
jgi:2-C-methyl-D-erythritol 4-phosphate cytidylyltransferase